MDNETKHTISMLIQYIDTSVMIARADHIVLKTGEREENFNFLERIRQDLNKLVK